MCPSQVQLSFIPGKIKKLLDFGQEHRMQTSQGTLKKSAIAMNIINFIIDLRHNAEVVRILHNEGGTFLDLIQRAMDQYVKRRGR